MDSGSVLCPAGTTAEEGVIFVWGVFNKPVSAVESTVYITAIFKQHALRILHKYLPLYREADRRDMLAQVRWAPFTLAGIQSHTLYTHFNESFLRAKHNVIFQVKPRGQRTFRDNMGLTSTWSKHSWSPDNESYSLW